MPFAIIPALIYFHGKGVYCGWICSCGGLAETLGDDQRHKMPHGAGDTTYASLVHMREGEPQPH